MESVFITVLGDALATGSVGIPEDIVKSPAGRCGCGPSVDSYGQSGWKKKQRTDSNHSSKMNDKDSERNSHNTNATTIDAATADNNRSEAAA